MNDGMTRDVMPNEILERGTMVRRYNDDGTLPPFEDSLVMHIDVTESGAVCMYDLIRPYSYLLPNGGIETYTEKYSVTPSAMETHFRVVCMSTGKPVNFAEPILPNE
jgi:hypothetical protein